MDAPATFEVAPNRRGAYFMLAAGVVMPFFPLMGVSIYTLTGWPLVALTSGLGVLMISQAVISLASRKRVRLDPDAISLPSGERLPWRSIATLDVVEYNGFPLLTIRLKDGGERRI